jgi:hypothetical protein
LTLPPVPERYTMGDLQLESGDVIKDFAISSPSGR